MLLTPVALAKQIQLCLTCKGVAIAGITTYCALWAAWEDFFWRLPIKLMAHGVNAPE